MDPMVSNFVTNSTFELLAKALSWCAVIESGLFLQRVCRCEEEGRVGGEGRGSVGGRASVNMRVWKERKESKKHTMGIPNHPGRVWAKCHPSKNCDFFKVGKVSLMHFSPFISFSSFLNGTSSNQLNKRLLKTLLPTPFTTMASVMLFPNVATHRKLPHLAPKDSSGANKQQQQQLQSTTPSDDKHHHHHHRSISDGYQGKDRDYYQSLDQKTDEAIAAAAPRTIESNTSKQHSLMYPKHGQSDKTLTIHTNKDHVHGQQKHDRIHLQDDRHHPPLTSVLSPHAGHASAKTPLSALPPSGVSASSSSSTSSPAHDARPLRTALYDAFGCLYHPVQHTHHPMAVSSSSTSSSLSSQAKHHPAPDNHTSNTSTRSGEATPLLGISPRESPMLRPHHGPSAPITPLELSEDGTGGYFGSASAASTAQSPWQHHILPHQHAQYHNHTPRHHHNHHYRPANHPAHKVEHNDGDHHGPRTTLSRKSSFEFNLDPTEHPVLSSLHTLSLTHPHPPEHYHPHLGHDLGHDRVAIIPTDVLLKPATKCDHPQSARPTYASVAALPPHPSSELPSHLLGTQGFTRTSSSFPMDEGTSDPTTTFQQQGLL